MTLFDLWFEINKSQFCGLCTICPPWGSHVGVISLYLYIPGPYLSQWP